MKAINRKNVRDALKTQYEPHWGPELGEGIYLGFRKTKHGEGRWVVRRQRGQKKRYSTLGRVVDLSYNDARAKALEWAVTVSAGVQGRHTVTEACRSYVENQHTVKTPKASEDSDRRFRQLVYDAPLGAKYLDQLTPDDVEQWRNDQASRMRNASVNRNLRSLRAALNYARSKRWVVDDFDWASVKPLKDDTRSREEYLTLEQREALLAASPASLRAFLIGLERTGCRVGELRQAKVSDFNSQTGTLKLGSDKGSGNATRSRTVPLSEEDQAFFRQVRGDRIGDMALFTDHRGQPWTERALNKSFAKARAKANVPSSVVMYAYRHVRLTDLLTHGFDVATVQRITDTSFKQIQKHYYKLRCKDVQDKLKDIPVVDLR